MSITVGCIWLLLGELEKNICLFATRFYAVYLEANFVIDMRHLGSLNAELTSQPKYDVTNSRLHPM
jgi:hypothetical protein